MSASDTSDPWVITFDDDGSKAMLPTWDLVDPWMDALSALQNLLGGEVNLIGGPTMTGTLTIDGRTRPFTLSGGPPPRDMRPRCPSNE